MKLRLLISEGAMLWNQVLNSLLSQAHSLLSQFRVYTRVNRKPSTPNHNPLQSCLLAQFRVCVQVHRDRTLQPSPRLGLALHQLVQFPARVRQRIPQLACKMSVW
jgi:hypothetical protein